MPDSNPPLITRLLSPIRSISQKIRDVTSLEDVRNADGLDELSDLDGLRATWLPFKGQQWYHHLLVFAFGIAIWIAVYAGIMHWFGWVEYAAMDTPEAITHRRQATTGAFAVAVTYYSVMWSQARGGFVTNLVWFPALTLGLMPRSILGLFTGKPEQRFSEGSFSTGPAQFSADAMSVIIPAYIILFFVIVLMWAYYAYGGDRGHRYRVEWRRKWPNIYLKDGPDEDWDELHDDLKEVYLEAGYDPKEDFDDEGDPADYAIPREGSEDNSES